MNVKARIQGILGIEKLVGVKSSEIAIDNKIIGRALAARYYYLTSNNKH
jgi:hypothetical protein